MTRSVKMAVNDLFLGGVEERVDNAHDVEDDDDDDNNDDDDTTKLQQHQERQSTTSSSTSTHGESAITSTTNQSPNKAEAYSSKESNH